MCFRCVMLYLCFASRWCRHAYAAKIDVCESEFCSVLALFDIHTDLTRQDDIRLSIHDRCDMKMRLVKTSLNQSQSEEAVGRALSAPMGPSGQQIQVNFLCLMHVVHLITAICKS